MQVATLGAGIDTQTTKRARLRVLDACLTELEEANERDEIVVSPRLAGRLGEHVRAVAPGMTISQAIELVLREQEPHLQAPPVPAAERGRVPRQPVEPLDAAGAGALTERIREATHLVCLLLLEAYERRAAAALGYRTWALYVQREFNLSRRRSYELLDQARVMRTLQAAAGLCGIPHISAHAAQGVKPQLDDVAAAVRRRVDGLDEERRMAVVAEAVRAARERAGTRRDAPAASSPVRRASVAQLVQAIDAFAEMPAAEEMARRVTPDQAGLLRGLNGALRWLSEFARALEEREGRRHGLRPQR